MNAPRFLSAALLSWAVAVPAHAAGPFDGTYAGRGQLAPGGNFNCPTEYGGRQVTIVDGAFSFKHNTILTIDAKVAPDGTISGSGYAATMRGGGTQTLSGKVSGDTIEMDTANDRCTFHVTMKKKP